MQIHFSGGEPTARGDLEALVERAHAVDLYTNLITAGVMLSESRFDDLVAAGLDYVQLSVQDSEPAGCDRISGYPSAYKRKMEFAALVRRAGLPLTLNVVVHRQRSAQSAIHDQAAVELGARRLEVAHVQYYGWAYRNRAALMPTRDQLQRATEIVEDARRRLKGC